MKIISEVIGRLLAKLVSKNIITEAEADWVLEPVKEAIEGQDKDERRKL